MGLQNIVPGGEVHGQLLGHVLLVLGGLRRHSFHGGHRIAADLLQLAVGLTQMRLLGGEDGIGIFGVCGGSRVQYAFLLDHALPNTQRRTPKRSPPL